MGLLQPELPEARVFIEKINVFELSLLSSSQTFQRRLLLLRRSMILGYLGSSPVRATRHECFYWDDQTLDYIDYLPAKALRDGSFY